MNKPQKIAPRAGVQFHPLVWCTTNGVADIFVVGAILALVYIWPMFERVGVVHERLVGYDVQDLLIAGC